MVGSPGGVAQNMSDIDIVKQGAAAIVTLNRPKALHALTDDMRRELAVAMPDFSRDPMIYGMVIRSEGSRAFCAGGDVRQLVALGRQDIALARASFADEYRLNWRLECFSKPTVSLINGAVMGSGVGLTVYGTHRVAGEGYQFAMPETAIGLFPDVGVCHHLARMPHEIGTYLGLTGTSIGRADAFALGLVTHCIPAVQFQAITEAVSDADPVDDLLDPLHEEPGETSVMTYGPDIAEWFAGPSIMDIAARLEAAAQLSTETGAFAAKTLSRLRECAPLSLAVTLRHLRAARHYDQRDMLMADYGLACAFLDGSDFYEGVRAALIDKDRSPSWQPAGLESVTDHMVARYFAPGTHDTLELATRTEMQAARA